MIDPSLIIGIIGVILALIGIGFSYVKTKNIEKRFEEKERMKELTKKLSKLIEYIRFDQIESIKRPFSSVTDVGGNLDFFVQQILYTAFNQKTKSFSVKIDFDIISLDYDETLYEPWQRMGKATKVPIDFVKDYTTRRLILTVNGTFDKDVGSFDLYSAAFIFKDIKYIEEEYGNYVNEFSPNILNDINKTLENILITIIESAKHNSTIEIDIDEFVNTSDICMYIHDKTVSTDKVKRDVDELEKLVDKLDKVRSDILTTAYS